MSGTVDLKVKLGLNVFKPVSVPHIKIRQGMEKDRRLKSACQDSVLQDFIAKMKHGEVVLATIDGCLECGTCRLACGTRFWTGIILKEARVYSFVLVKNGTGEMPRDK